jgi:high affinity Mn2+ porin
LNGAFDLPFNFDFMAGTGSYAAGLQGGYNYVLPSRLMLGFEVDASFPNSDVLIPYSMRGSQTVTSPSIGQATYGEAVIYYGTARARVGYAFDHFLLYGTGGLAWTYDQVTRTQVAGSPVGGSATPGTVDTALMWRLGGLQEPAWKSRSPATGPQKPNICGPGLATLVRYFRRERRVTIPTSLCEASGLV